MTRTAFVADSTIGLSPPEALEQGIHIVPMQIIVDGIGYKDFGEFGPERVNAAQRAGQRVTTSQANPADLDDAYASLLERHDRVVSVHVSSKLSGTAATARMIAERYGGRVTVIDSLSLNAGLGYVLEAARQATADGVPPERLEAAIAELRRNVHGLIVPRSLDGLLRSGRINGLQHFVASMLKLVPLLHLQDGAVVPLERVRGFHNALERLAVAFHRLYPSGARVTLAHADNPEAVQTLAELLRKEGVVLEGVRQAGPAVSVHTGPGTVALFAAPRK